MRIPLTSIVAVFAVIFFRLAIFTNLGRAIGKLIKKLAGKRVAILGCQHVGKTTLLRFLQDGKLPKLASETLDRVPGGEFDMDVGSGTVHFEVPEDLPGNDGDRPGFVDWKKAFLDADYVWYLFRADLIAQGDLSEINMVKGHLDLFKGWMDDERFMRPKIILIGTQADKHPGYEQDIGKFKRDVSGADPISVGMVKLNNAGLVVGSLLTGKDSNMLIKSLGSCLG